MTTATPGTKLDRVVPGLYGTRDPLTFYVAPREIARLHHLPEDVATLDEIVSDARAQLEREFPQAAIAVLPDDVAVPADLASGESGSNGLITPRAGFDSPTPPRPWPWRAEVKRRVADYRARHQDRAYRAAHGLDVSTSDWRVALWPGRARSVEGGASHRLPGRQSLVEPSRALAIGVAALVLAVLSGGPLLEAGWTKTGGLVLGLGVAAFFSAALWTACSMGDGLGDKR